MKSIPRDLILRIEHLSVSRYQCTALASPNRYRKRYKLRDLTVQLAEDGARAIDFTLALRNEQVLRGSLPAGVREVIRARLAHLPPNALLLLTAGAVLGRSFPFERLCQVAGINENAGLSALEALLASRLLAEVENEEKGPSEERFLCRHLYYSFYFTLLLLAHQGVRLSQLKAAQYV